MFEVEEAMDSVVEGRVEFVVVSVAVVVGEVVVFVVDVGELVIDSVVVVVEAAVVVVVVVGSGQSTNSGQLQTLILKSKYRPEGQDINIGVRLTHS